MKLAWKATALILINVVITFSAGLLARNYLLNPELAKIERTNDEKTLTQLALIQELITASLIDSANRARQAAATIRSDHWKAYSSAISSVASSSDFGYLISTSAKGDFSQVRPGRYFHESAAPSPSDIRQIITRARAAPRYPYVDFITLPEGTSVIAAQQLRHPDNQGPELFIVVSRIDEAFINRISAFAGVDLQLISFEERAQILQEPRALSGIRSESNNLQWTVNDARGQPAVSFAVGLPPRSYDDKILTPTLATALFFTLLMWSGAIWLLYRTLIRPMNAASKTLQQIMTDQDYGRRLEYPHPDEFGQLTQFFNRLLNMVDQRTSELELLSLTDPLTDLNNRRAFDVQSHRVWPLAERADTRMALIAFDLDHFKAYNDTYGHPAGDKVIKTFARILGETFKRASDVVARVGGEEFLVLTQDSPSGASQVLTHRVLQALREERIEHAGNTGQGIVTASAGIFHCVPDANLTLELALQRADEILYAAKENGRNRAMYSDALVDNVNQVTSAEVIQLPY
ncbi:diguanylate cyclase (GGDEF)-like protein [Litorivivens lipolytica]|uniref:diguanylate cyclase n=1 Tax=Litorivivens lipolytica TaxID=1524264 RepID=A0A7W4W5F6_9GAMM|nr:diguanylate cyclase [Litorivivens lipolytica]MBB3047797.1 diguanylate cyclase (GGDEF)-like protein [Litorivivens lipolytica]